MYLLYVDESGLATNAKNSSKYFTLAGIALHEEDVYPFSQSLHKVQLTTVGSELSDLELHASRIWAGRSEWSRVDEALRRTLLAQVRGPRHQDEAGSGCAFHLRRPRFFLSAITI